MYSPLMRRPRSKIGNEKKRPLGLRRVLNGTHDCSDESAVAPAVPKKEWKTSNGSLTQTCKSNTL